MNQQQKVIAERMEINPFGLRFGHPDIALVSGNSVGETKPNNAFDFLLPFPVSNEIFKKLPANGFCKKEFGTRLLETSKVFHLTDVPSPLVFNSFLDEGLIYKITVNPIMGIYDIEAEIRAPIPKKPYWDEPSWSDFVYKNVSEKITPILKEKYSSPFFDGKFDMQGRLILSGVGKNHHPLEYKYRTTVGYGWDSFQVLDWIDKEESKFSETLRRCINDEINAAKSEIKKERDLEAEEQKKKQLRLENESKDKLKKAL